MDVDYSVHSQKLSNSFVDIDYQVQVLFLQSLGIVCVLILASVYVVSSKISSQVLVSSILHNSCIAVVNYFADTLQKLLTT